jgi:CHAT domain-containing protein/tetratricopeptide (TPR) repeat protein
MGRINTGRLLKELQATGLPAVCCWVGGMQDAPPEARGYPFDGHIYGSLIITVAYIELSRDIPERSWSVIQRFINQEESSDGRSLSVAEQDQDVQLVQIQEDAERRLKRVVQLFHEARYEEGIALATEALEFVRQGFGQEDQRYADALNVLAELYRASGNYAAAEPLYLQSGEILRMAGGENHLAYSTVLNNLGVLYESMGNCIAAEPLLLQALDIRRKTLGEHHPSCGNTLNNLAECYHATGNYTDAESMYRQASEIIRVALGEGHPSYATSLHNLGELYETMGQWAAAERLFRQAVNVRRTALGENHPHFAVGLNSLAALYASMGDYAQAEKLYRQACDVFKGTVGERHPDYGACRNNLAGLYASMGRFADAELLFQQALKIAHTTYGEHHESYLRCLVNLSGLYISMGNFAASDPLYRKLSNIFSCGEDGPTVYATSEDSILLGLYRACLDNAAKLSANAQTYPAMSNYAIAELLLQRAIEITGTILGKDHPYYADCLSSLAGVYDSMGNYTSAQPLLQRALEIRRTVFGEGHPHVATSLNALAVLYGATARISTSLSLMRRAALTDDRMIGQVFSIGSERQRTAFINTVQANMATFLSLVWQHLVDAPYAVCAALDLVLRRKAIGAEAMAAQRDALFSGKYTALVPQLREWTALRGQIALKTLAGSGQEGRAAHQRVLAQWEEQKERLERDLARRIPETNLEQKLRTVDRRAVAMALPAGVALIEFVRFDVLDFQAVPARGEPRWKAARYLAFVLAAGEPDDVKMIDLGEAEPIDRMIANFRASLTGESDRHSGRDVIKCGVKAVPVSPSDTALSLRAAVFDKLAVPLADRKRLFLAPDGDLTRLPFEVLPTNDGRLLLDDYCISYLGCGRDVLRFGAESTGGPARSLVVADPAFDLALEKGGTFLHPANRAEPAASSEAAAGFWSRWFGRRKTCRPAETQSPATRSSRETPEPRGRRSRDLARSQYHFGRLLGTCVEGERIASMLGVQPWLDTAALEGALKRGCHSPRILHLATHGFFLEDQKHDPNRPSRDLGVLAGLTDDMGRLADPLPENPLLRSGLALAGANTWLRHGSLPEEAEDGLLTAEDVSGLDLLATELVVLSACETGLGEVHTGEGVFGLRRAFVLAGAKTLIMSLWKVPDLATGVLMERFYENILNRGLGRSEALRDAQFATRDATIGQLREHWLSPEVIERLGASDPEARRHLQVLAQQPDDARPFRKPLYWGAFICQGDPGPLPRTRQ